MFIVVINISVLKKVGLGRCVASLTFDSAAFIGFGTRGMYSFTSSRNRFFLILGISLRFKL